MSTQQFDFPSALASLVQRTTYRENWEISLEDKNRGQGSEGLTVCVLIRTPDSYHPDRLRSVMHYMPVPPAAYNEQSWRRWLFEQILLVERHEAMEFFQIDGERPYAPNHGPGNDCYLVTELGTDEARRTSYKGEVRV